MGKAQKGSYQEFKRSSEFESFFGENVMKKAVLAGLMFLGLVSTSAYAWDGTVQGKIWRIDVTATGNYTFRVMLQGSPVLCGATNWAYLDEVDTNYKVYAATLLAAKASGSDTVIYTTKDQSGYCKVGYVAVM